MMGIQQQSSQLTWAWAQQRIWSQAADRLKQRIDQARRAAAFIDVCEAAISVENQAWMARWDAPDQDK